MSFPRTNTSQVFEARLQNLYEQIDPVLKLLLNLTAAEQTFLSFWDEDYNGTCRKGSISHNTIDFNGYQLAEKLTVFYDVIYIANSRLHTLVRDIPFFIAEENSKNVFLLPLIDSADKKVGVIGLNMSSQDNFDSVIHQIEVVAAHVLEIYEKLSPREKNFSSSKVNLDNLPASFMNFCVDEDANVLDCQLSRSLLLKHPALQDNNRNVIGSLESVLQLSIKELCEMLSKSNKEQNIEYVYPFFVDGCEKKYFLIKLHASPKGDGRFTCLACITDVSIHYRYNTVLDQILFDISHVMRRPVVSMKGLTNLIDLNEFDRSAYFDITEKIKIVSEEMEDYIGAMFKIYKAKQDAEYRL